MLSVAIYRLALPFRFSPRLCTDWLYTQVLAAAVYRLAIHRFSPMAIVQIGFRQVLAVAIYRLALYSFAPWLYTDWLCTGSRRGYIQIRYIQVLAVALYKLAIYIYRCYIQTGPNISLHRSIRSNPAHRVSSSARWLIATHLMVECTNCIEEQVGESSLKVLALLAFSRQVKCGRPRSVRARRAGHIAISKYCNPCETVQNARKREAPATRRKPHGPHGAVGALCDPRALKFYGSHDLTMQIHTGH